MSAALDRWLTRLYHAVGGSLFLAACACVSYSAGDWPWPDHVRSAERPTPDVPSGAARPDGCRAMLPGAARDAPPRDPDGTPRTVGTDIPAAFPSGPAMPLESPSADGNRVQRTVRRRRQPDAITPFTATYADGLTGPPSPPTARAP